MKKHFCGAKNICKKVRKSAYKNNTCLEKRKMPFAVGFWGQFITGNSDKESSHVGGKFLNAGDGQL